MDDTRNMLREAVGRVLAEQVTSRETMAAEAAGIDAKAWAQLRQLGVTGAQAPGTNIPFRP